MNRILRRVNGHKRDKDEMWKGLHGLDRLSNTIKSRRLRWTGLVDGERSTFKVLTGKVTGKRPLGKHWYRFEDSIRIEL